MINGAVTAERFYYYFFCIMLNAGFLTLRLILAIVGF